MSRGTCHLFLESPTARVADIEAGDVVVDLRLDASGRSLTPSGVSESLVRTDVAARRYHDLARDAYIEWIAEVADRPLDDEGRSLKELFVYRDELSIWWLLRMQVKHYVKHPLPGLFQRLVWLEDQDEPETLFGACERVVIYAEQRQTCEFMWRIMCQKLPSFGRREVQFCGLDAALHPCPGRLTRAAAELGSRADAAIRRVGQIGGFLGSKALRTLRNEVSSVDLDGVEVALVTELSEWHVVTNDDGTKSYEHRYLADAAHRLRRSGLNVCWLPVTDRYERFHELRECLADQEVPVAWSAAEAGLAESTRAVAGLGELRSQLRDVRELLDGHPALRFGELDASAWIIGELEEEFDVHGLYHLQRYEMTRAALEHLEPDVVLYRNEFYASGRAVAAAAGGISERWAFQHATIPHHHWVYQHSARELGDQSDFIHQLPAPDRFLVYGAFVQELMTRYGYPAERISALGSLRHDQMFERAGVLDDQERRRIADGLGFPDDRPTFLICAQMPVWLTDWIGLLVDGLEQFGEPAHVVVKPHWLYKDVAAIHQAFAQRGWTDYLVYEGDLESALMAADVSLTGSSTTGLESAILGTPLISFQREQPWETMPYVEDGLALPAADLDSMVRALEDVTSDEFKRGWPERRRRFLERHLLNVSQPAGEALVELLGAYLAK
jgi:glycosyltransferase involved in cell wall biosynthesis